MPPVDQRPMSSSVVRYRLLGPHLRSSSSPQIAPVGRMRGLCSDFGSGCLPQFVYMVPIDIVSHLSGWLRYYASPLQGSVLPWGSPWVSPSSHVGLGKGPYPASKYTPGIFHNMALAERRERDRDICWCAKDPTPSVTFLSTVVCKSYM
uniref:Uncharacterized protein n=1 Tax=Amorphochlora amoebiformis TaxID=1561963 RepID=A0A7S0CVR1_9EUKA|mmetsp:Transcript_14448/g.22925  ORF Transcript_14448/g.22925 Transcript_14448/m.22925 type:complete len:149 (+) Transcript_14448:239-685(+)|eukprot:1321840-Amorphochlora_amoeboformis.AAC.2